MRLEDARVEAGVVGGEARDGDGAFVRGEPRGLERVGGREEEEGDRPGDGEGAEDYEGELLGVLGSWVRGEVVRAEGKEFVYLPCRQSAVDVSNAVLGSIR